jgi:hypothetical protein
MRHPCGGIFDLDSVTDGDWLGMETSRASTLMPDDIEARFGKNVTAIFNNDYLDALAAKAQIVAMREERVFGVTRDDVLINSLYGRDTRSVG